MFRFFICIVLALAAGCNYNQYPNKETGTPDTAAKDMPTQRTAAPEGQTIEATSSAECQGDAARE